MIQIIKGDLFNAPNEYCFAHCISSDFALGKGIATVFNKKFGIRDSLNIKCEDLKGQFPIVIGLKMKRHDRVIFNLVTKRHYWNKPTLSNLEVCLEELKFKMDYYSMTKLAIPKLGCGLDRLEWTDVYGLLEKLFKDKKYDIVVYTLD